MLHRNSRKGIKRSKLSFTKLRRVQKKGKRRKLTVLHGGNTVCVPFGNICIKGRPAIKNILHILHRTHVPVTNSTVHAAVPASTAVRSSCKSCATATCCFTQTGIHCLNQISSVRRRAHGHRQPRRLEHPSK